MKSRFCESRIAEHLLVLSKGISVSRVRSCQHDQTESGRDGRRDAVFVRNKFERDGFAPGLERGINAAHQFFTSGCVKMMKDICQQNEVVAFAEFDFKRASRSRRMAVGNTEFLGVFLRYFQHRRPVHGDNLGVRIALR